MVSEASLAPFLWVQRLDNHVLPTFVLLPKSLHNYSRLHLPLYPLLPSCPHYVETLLVSIKFIFLFLFLLFYLSSSNISIFFLLVPIIHLHLLLSNKKTNSKSTTYYKTKIKISILKRLKKIIKKYYKDQKSNKNSLGTNNNIPLYFRDYKYIWLKYIFHTSNIAYILNLLAKLYFLF